MPDSGSCSAASFKKHRNKKRAATAADSGSSSDASLKKRMKTEAAMDASRRRVIELIKEEMYPPEDDAYKRYCKQIRDSDGFDIVDYPNPANSFWLFHVPVSIVDPEDIKLTTLADLALYHYNYIAKTKYIFSKLLYANIKSIEGPLYYITFEAAEKKNHDPAVVKTFQARVWLDRPHSKLKVYLCRIKNEFPCYDGKGLFGLNA